MEDSIRTQVSRKAKESPDAPPDHESAKEDASGSEDANAVEREPTITAYVLNEAPRMPLVPAPSAREWMSRTRSRFAYRCLPMLIANQDGWCVLNSHRLQATWNGGIDAADISIEYQDRSPPYPAVSHFGEGILTWQLPYLFKTSPQHNLLVRGPANLPKDGIYALEGLVETDWAPSTFTMNWKFTSPHKTVTFEVDEPVCMLVPQRRGELESFRARVSPFESDQELLRSYRRWSESRSRFLTELKVPGSKAAKEGWERHYFLGRDPEGRAAPGHQTKLRLREFARHQ